MRLALAVGVLHFLFMYRAVILATITAAVTGSAVGEPGADSVGVLLRAKASVFRGRGSASAVARRQARISYVQLQANLASHWRSNLFV